jgi:hypothetical protein
MEPVLPSGRLPPGIHSSTLGELEAQFGANPHRRRLCASLRKLVRLAVKCGFVREIYVDGSFVTAKPHPEDVDLILGIDDLPKDSNPLSARDRAQRMRALRRCGGGLLHVFLFPVDHWRLADLLDYFSNERPSDGGGRKGIVKLSEWNDG